jgi:hypothetical protein
VGARPRECSEFLAQHDVALPVKVR